MEIGDYVVWRFETGIKSFGRIVAKSASGAFIGDKGNYVGGRPYFLSQDLNLDGSGYVFRGWRDLSPMPEEDLQYYKEEKEKYGASRASKGYQRD